ncbi:T-SNARE coiled-coil-like proteiny domain-containing protein [Aphelenchoides besseyi]|nr:T-SNARE coiled-coil-like proteiny domain-containing protein [Aphelenchoides besseyi]
MRSYLMSLPDQLKEFNLRIHTCPCNIGMSATLALLTEFEQQYSVGTADITAKIGQLQQLLPSERTAASNEIRRLLSDVEELLEQMELSVRELDSTGPDRSKYENHVRSFRIDRKNLEAEFKRAVTRLQRESDRDDLLDGGFSVDQEDQLIANTERMDRTSRKIQDAYRVTVETEEIGSSVLQNLSQQRETLNRARERLREGESELSSSNRLLQLMIQRVIQNRLILIVVTFVMMFMLLIMMYRAI